MFGRQVTHLDLGCAGGGLVRDFLIRGHQSMGLEGSDWSLLEQRAEWRALGPHLRTCDITQPFDILDPTGAAVGFDVISAWEVLEHLPRTSLPRFFDNVRRHLGPEGLFVASIALFEDRDPQSGAVWHVTLEPPEWWAQCMAEAGLSLVASPFAPRDYVRGSGSSIDDWDAVAQPDMGFHVVARVTR
jgi:cyclopropane fatty-acyl-phospholipid synthase-like methyltransferase